MLCLFSPHWSNLIDCSEDYKEIYDWGTVHFLLAEYADQNFLQVNIEKTKIVHFHKGREKRIRPFYYKGEIIEVTSSFTYLGVIFSNTGLFYRASKSAHDKALSEAAGVLDICRRSKLVTWESRIQLNDSLLLAVSFMGSKSGDRDI